MQQAIAHTSVVLSFIVLLFMILYHVNTHTTLLSVLHDNETMKNITGKFETKPVHKVECPLPHGNGIDDILDITNSPSSGAGYELESRSKSVEPTSSELVFP